jgi:AraC family transcriptional regulator, regulatory protein of adaptative response / methylated-DNA-[protein]-cysteine methyltransferase
MPPKLTPSAHPAKSSRKDSRWAAVAARDKTYDGKFYYSVASTGIYCRPSCPARLAKREYVGFHDTPASARAAGFRACKRCKPDQPPLDVEYAAKVTDACRAIEKAEDDPSLKALAAKAKLSPHHFHRIFKSVTGVTPKAYATAHRHRRVRDTLNGSVTVTNAIHASGYNSSGTFYAGSKSVLGMRPSEFRAGGAHAELKFAVGQCSLGAILVAATAKGVAAILLGDDAEILLRDLQDRFPKAKLTGADPAFERLAAKVIAFADLPRGKFDLPLDVRGTAFQHKVWQALQAIPAGSTVSYSDIAERIAMPKAARAVAQACGANPVAVAIPCHRVVRTDGTLSGYRWGIERKRILLDREAKPRPRRD